MECSNTNSSPFTISLDYEEDIESKKHQMYSSLDSLIVNCGEKVKRKKHHRHESKCEHKRRNENHRKENTDSFRTKFITQEVYVQRQDFKCIINLNTTVCNHNNSHRISCNEKSSENSTSNNNKDRTVPRCLRQTCHKYKHNETRVNRHSKKNFKTDLHHRTRDLNRTHKCLGQSKHVYNKCKPAPQHEKKTTKAKLSGQDFEIKHSPPKNQLQFKYEDISNKSLDNYLDIPTSYKYSAKTCKKEYHQSKLDTLIKRTKERERKLVEQSRTTNPWYTSTPYTEVSSVEFPMTCSEIDVSLASRSTLVLEPWDHGYSPSVEGFYPTKAESYYSSSSPNENNWLKFPETDYELQIKSEPRLDIEAYSPTQSLDLHKFSRDEEIKIEPKTEKLL